LRTGSLIRLGFVATLTVTEIGGVLGAIAPDRLQRLRQNLVQHLNS
jgi:hypothetical protein